MRFSTKVTLLLVVSMVVFGSIITLFVYNSNVKTLEKEVISRLEVDVHNTMNKIDMFLYERYSDIQVIPGCSDIKTRNSEPEKITERLIEFRNIHKTYASLSFFNLERIRIADTAGMHLGKKHKLTKYWKDIYEGKISAASDVRIAEELHTPILYFASHVKDVKGENFGVIVARVPVIRIYEITKEIERTRGGEGKVEVDLVDKDGMLLYSNYNRKGVLKDNLADELQSVERSLAGEKSGSAKYTRPGKEETIYVFVHEQGYLDFEGNDWTLVVNVPTKTAFAPAVDLRNKIVVILIPIIVVLILISLFFLRIMLKPIVKLKDAAVEISKGNLDVKVEIKSKDEIGELADSFNTMSVNLKQANNEILGHSKELEEKVTQRTEELNSSNKELTEINEKMYYANKDIKEAAEKTAAAEKEAVEAKELAEKKSEAFEKFNKMAVGREVRMRELKQEMKELEDKIKGMEKDN
ncbi:MAG: HAMP domain-containing protein [Waddliaceae bacterium]|nr:HAMP domain-containing protein [Waddliaceae bacterium]